MTITKQTTRARHLTVSCLLLGSLFWSSPLHAVDEAALFKNDLWKIAPKGSMQRWIIIHNLEEAKSSGIFHIEVIGRNKGQPRYAIQHLASHMAITLNALKKSVLSPLKSGAVYPESFHNAYDQWLAKPESDREVCGRSVVECLQDVPKASETPRGR